MTKELKQWQDLETGKGGSLSASVIVINYNNGPYTRACLDSILQQTYKNIEIIVSDENSTDSSPVSLPYRFPNTLNGKKTYLKKPGPAG